MIRIYEGDRRNQGEDDEDVVPGRQNAPSAATILGEIQLKRLSDNRASHAEAHRLLNPRFARLIAKENNENRGIEERRSQAVLRIVRCCLQICQKIISKHVVGGNLSGKEPYDNYTRKIGESASL